MQVITSTEPLQKLESKIRKSITLKLTEIHQIANSTQSKAKHGRIVAMGTFTT
jgi:hypothetical protein